MGLELHQHTEDVKITGNIYQPIMSVREVKNKELVVKITTVIIVIYDLTEKSTRVSNQKEKSCILIGKLQSHH